MSVHCSPRWVSRSTAADLVTALVQMMIVSRHVQEIGRGNARDKLFGGDQVQPVAEAGCRRR